MSRESPQRNVEEMLASGPPTSWFAGYGGTNVGILGIHYSDEFARLAAGKAERAYAGWCHMVPNLPTTKTRNIQARLADLERTVIGLTGFPPQEILEKKRALTQAFHGKTTAPFPVYLVDPLEPSPTAQPPLEWFSGIAKGKEGIKRVLLSNLFESLDNGELFRQVHEWGDFMANDHIGSNQPPEKRRAAKEIVTFASHYVRVKTGYFPDAILRRRNDLEETWRGQQEAPFEIEYVD